jgi:hypothetical protein
LEETSLPPWQQEPPASAQDTTPSLEGASLPPWQQPTASAPDTPNPWLIPTTSTSKAARTAATQAKVREANSLATTNNQVNKILGEYTDLPFYSPDPKQNIHNAIHKLLTQHFDWPDNMISCIKQVLGTPCNMPSDPEFRFELSEEVAKHNLEVIQKYKYNLGGAIKAQKDSPFGPGKEFKPPDVLQQVFGLHPLWSHMEAILTHGSKWPLVKISKEE